MIRKNHQDIVAQLKPTQRPPPGQLNSHASCFLTQTLQGKCNAKQKCFFFKLQLENMANILSSYESPIMCSGWQCSGQEMLPTPLKCICIPSIGMPKAASCSRAKSHLLRLGLHILPPLVRGQGTRPEEADQVWRICGLSAKLKMQKSELSAGYPKVWSQSLVAVNRTGKMFPYIPIAVNRLLNKTHNSTMFSIVLFGELFKPLQTNFFIQS